MKTNALRCASWIATLWVLACVASAGGAGAQTPPAGAAGSVTMGPITFTLPPGWRLMANATPTLAQYTVTTSNPSEQAVVAFNVSPDASASTAAGHQLLWGELLRLTGAPNTQRAGQTGRFAWSEMQVTSARTSRDEWHRMYSTKEGNARVGVAVVANSPQAYATALAGAEPMMAAARAETDPSAAAAPGGGARPGPAASPQGAAPAGDVPIVEAHVHIDVRAVTNTSNVLTDHILFFGNGIVAREGVINGPRECYVLYDVRNLAKLPFNYGRWREDKGAGTLQIQWQEGPPWTLSREGNRLSLGGKRLLVLRPLDGLRLDGVYEYRPVGSPPSRLELRPDGRFEAANLLERMGCPTQMPPGALAGAGTYDVRKWTLILRFANGRVTPLPLHVEGGEDLRNVGKFWLNGSDFARVR